MSIAFSVTKNKSTTDHRKNPERWGAFNEAIQVFLLPRLCERGMVVDPYDGGEFSASQLEHVEKSIREVSESLAAIPDDLCFSEEMIAFYNSYGSGLPLSPKESALRSLSQLELFCKKAKLENEILVFVGD